MVLGRKEGRKQIRRSKGGGAKRGIGKDSMIASKKHESFFFFNFQPAKARFFTNAGVNLFVSQAVNQSVSQSFNQSVIL